MHESLMRRTAGVHSYDNTPRALMPLKAYTHNACMARPQLRQLLKSLVLTLCYNMS